MARVRERHEEWDVQSIAGEVALDMDGSSISLR